MNDLFEQHIKHFPHMIKYCIFEVRTHYKYYLIMLSIMLLFLFLTVTQLLLRDAIDVQLSTSFFRLTGFYAYVWIFLALFHSEKTIRKQGALYNRISVPYYVGTSAQVFITMIMFLFVITLSGLISTNMSEVIDINHLGFFYYLVMTYILLVPLSSIIGKLGEEYYNTRFILFGSLILLLFLVPIIYVPENMYAIWVNVLKVNPFFYVINGFQQTMILGESSGTVLPYHVMFYFQLALIYLIWINVNRISKTEYFKK